LSTLNWTCVGFHVYRVSKIGINGAAQLGRRLRGVLRRKSENKRKEIIAKANRRLDKRQDRLRLLLKDLVQGEWLQWMEDRRLKDLRYVVTASICVYFEM